MRSLGLYIDESLFDGKDVETITRGAEGQAILDKLKKYTYDNLSRTLQRRSPWELGKISIEGNTAVVDFDFTKQVGRFAFNIEDIKSPLGFNIKFSDNIADAHPRGRYVILSISNCNIRSLRELFVDGTSWNKYKGNITIKDCPNLESLDGCPECDLLDITDCPKLQPDGLPKNVRFVWWYAGNPKVTHKDLENFINKGNYNKLQKPGSVDFEESLIEL